MKTLKAPRSKNRKQDMASRELWMTAVPLPPVNIPLKGCSVSLKFFAKQTAICVHFCSILCDSLWTFNKVFHHSVIILTCLLKGPKQPFEFLNLKNSGNVSAVKPLHLNVRSHWTQQGSNAQSQKKPCTYAHSPQSENTIALTFGKFYIFKLVHFSCAPWYFREKKNIRLEQHFGKHWQNFHIWGELFFTVMLQMSLSLFSVSSHIPYLSSFDTTAGSDDGRVASAPLCCIFFYCGAAPI